MEFEFNFGQQTLSKGVKKNETKYASVSGVALSLSEEELVFLDKDSGDNHVMTQQVLHALSLCQKFKPLDQHILAISNSLPELSNQVQAIQQVVDFLIKNKLLIKEQDWKEKLSIGSPESTVQNAGIVIRAFENPQLLNRCLQSLVKYQIQFNLTFPVQIYTVSNNKKIETEIENVCKNYRSDLNINIHGATWQGQFIKMLKKEFKKKHSIIDWLLASNEDCYNGGRLWNFALLNNAGKKFLFFDDDYIFEPRVFQQDSKIIELNDNPDLNVGFSLNLTDIRNSSQEYSKDVLSQMINSCGQSVGNWVSTTDAELGSLDRLNLIELQRISSNSVIKTISNGTWGSPRANSNYWLYNLEGNQKEEFWKSRDTYLENIEVSNLLHYTENQRFLSLGDFAPSAIDNSSMMTFVNPTNHGEDYFFNAVSLYSYPDQVNLQYPFMMGHIETGSKDQSGQNHIARTPNFNRFIADYALTFMNSTDAFDPKLRLKTLANYVMGLADSSDKNIHNRLKEYLSHVRSEMVLTMQYQLAQSPNAPVYWQADVRELIESNGKAVLQNNPPILGDWESNLSKEECVDRARNELFDIAFAMELWPDLWEFCQTNK